VASIRQDRGGGGHNPAVDTAAVDAAAVDSDRRARFGEVTREVYEPLQRYLARRAGADEADEVLNDALTVLWRRLDDVPATAPLPYCYGVARRCLANHRRGAQRRLRLLDRLAAQRVDAAPDPADGIDDDDPDLAAALASLTPAEREVVHLWGWERLEPREIAVVVGATPNAVSVALHRARRKLAAALGRQDPAAPGHNAGGRADEPRTADDER
jgi:RNA polymerase sigma-70 factor (ECF subfamily)